MRQTHRRGLSSARFPHGVCSHRFLSLVDVVDDVKKRLPHTALFLRGQKQSSTESNQAYRAISTGQLNALLRLHLRPIDVVVYHGPQGDLVLRGASRLDAFSGYPVRS